MQGALVGKLQYRVEGTLAFVSNGLQFERDSANSTQWVNGKELAVLQASYSSYNRTGVRAELNMPIQNFTLSAYTAMNAYGGQDQFVGSEGSIWGALVRFDRKELHATTNLKYVGARYNGTANGQVYALEDYLDWNIDLGYEINDNLSVSLKAYNLLNQEYQLFSGYKVRGTRGLFVLNYQF
jgi:outer membrane receptor for ferrienterochelin and colicin